MENRDDELFIRIVSIKTEFMESLKYFEAAKNIEDSFIRDGIVKVGIITYCKPFFSNTGVYEDLKKYKWSSDFIPENMVDTHRMLLNHRGNFIGHSNFKAMEPNLKQENTDEEGKGRLCISYKIAKYDGWFDLVEDDEGEFRIIDLVIELVSHIVDDMNFDIYYE